MGEPSAEERERMEAAVRGVVEAVVTATGLDATVVISPGAEEADLTARIDGDGVEVLVGRQGETIDAFQYLLTQIASRAAGPGGRRRVALDVGGYRERRAAALRDLARRAADEAVEYGEEIELDPMSPHDRRIVHMELKDIATVATRSEGDEPRRRIIVEPAE
jgi:spoIIIJ-associated protein